MAPGVLQVSFVQPDVSALPRHSLIIGDQKSVSGRGGVHGHIYPATGRLTREVGMANGADVDEAVKAARAAYPAWRALSGDRRRDLMFRLAAMCEQHAQELGQLSTIENGAI